MLQIITLIVVGSLLLAALILWLYGEHWRPLRLSTWRFMREAGLRRFLDFSALHAYVYGRWIKEYIYLLINHILPRLKPRGKKWWSDRYHGKVVTQEQAEAIITIDQNIPLRDLGNPVICC